MPAVHRPALRRACWVSALIMTVALGACSGGTSTTDTGAPTSRATVTELPDTSDSGSAKKVFKADQTDIRIGTGEKFAIRVPANPSVGDNWKLVSAPDDSFVKFEGESFKSDSPEPMPGSGGQTEFKFKAKKPGTTTVTLYNCYRCGTSGTVAPSDTEYAKRITFMITVA